jgi:hypothetical protein
LGLFVDFRSATFAGGEVSFQGAQARNGRFNFVGSRLLAGRLDFAYARLRNIEIDFSSTQFEGADVNFSNVHLEVKDEDVAESRMVNPWIERLAEKPLNERDMVWDPHPRAALQFNSARMDGGSITFEKPDLEGIVLDFVGVDFRGGRIYFDTLHAGGSVINLWNSRFDHPTLTEITIPDAYFLTVIYSEYRGGPVGRIQFPERVDLLEVSMRD